jgi:hypothetical protein
MIVVRSGGTDLKTTSASIAQHSGLPKRDDELLTRHPDDHQARQITLPLICRSAANKRTGGLALTLPRASFPRLLNAPYHLPVTLLGLQRGGARQTSSIASSAPMHRGGPSPIDNKKPRTQTTGPRLLQIRCG